jgi:hypothetical protein
VNRVADRRIGGGLLVGGLIALSVAGAQAAPMSRADYRFDLAHIAADYAAASKTCSLQTGNAARICAEEARAARALARAELDYRYSGKLDDQRQVLVVSANNAYSVARLKCADQARGNREVCEQQARSDLSRALANPDQTNP